MTSSQRTKARSMRTPLWYPNAPTRIRALLPELALSVVAMTCMSTVLSYYDGTDLITLVMAMAAVQTLVQAILYACTYIVQDMRWVVFVPFLLVAMAIPVSSMGAAIWGFSPVGTYAIPLSVGMGVMLFYLMRPRAGLIALLIELLVLGELVSEIPSLWAIHVVGLAAFAALLVMRSSATRITRSFVAEEAAASRSVDDAADDTGHATSMGIYGQVAALAAAATALCLAVALGGTWLTMPAMPADVAPAEAPTPAPQEEQSPAEMQPHDNTTTAEQTRDTAPRETGSRAGFGPLVLALLLAALALPVPVRLLMRARARRALAREPQAADRAAKLYQVIIARLHVAGIVRDEAETPRMFLEAHAEELEGLTTPAGIGLDAWTTLTETYEKARYAGLDPTPPELETCWRIYDALPVCVRVAVGWRSYLTSRFWRL